MKKYKKKIYTFGLFVEDVRFILKNISEIIKMKKNKKINKSFFEKIMTVVSAVNGCVYCKWFHAKQSLKAGISKDEVKNMMNLQFGTDASDFELPALLYAQHFAETNRNPDKEMTENFENFYGKETANHIMLIIRLIFYGNLTGNTFDAFLARFKGQKSENGNLIFEIFFFILNLPFLLPLTPFVKKYRK